MIRNISYVHPAGNGFTARLRPLLLVVPALLAAYAVAGPLSPTFASTNDGTVTVTADTSLAAPGSVVVYTVTLENGPQAGVVTLNDNLPPHTTLLDAPDCTTSNGGSVSCDFAMFPYDVVSTQVTVMVDADVNCNSQLRNSAHVQGWSPASFGVDVDCGTPQGPHK